MINAIIVGLGRVAGTHTEAILKIRDKIKIVAVCDLYQKNLNDFLNVFEKEFFYRPNGYLNYEQAILNENAELVIILTDSSSHFKIASFALNHGKHCLIEKPLTIDSSEAKKLEKLAKKNNAKIGVFFQNRFNGPVRLLEKAVKDGRFGKISNISARLLWNRDEEYYKIDEWRGKWQSNGGTFMNQSIHIVDIVQWLSSSPAEFVYSSIANRFHPCNEVEDYGFIFIEFENGIRGLIEATVNCKTDYEESIIIVGEKGFAEIAGASLNIVKAWNFDDKKSYDEEIFKFQFQDEKHNLYGDKHVEIYREFIESIENGLEFSVNETEATKSVNIILSAYKSFIKNKKVKLTDSFDVKKLNKIKLS